MKVVPKRTDYRGLSEGLVKLTVSGNRGSARQVYTHHCNAELGDTEGLANRTCKGSGV
jgi:hypothetical protein